MPSLLRREFFSLIFASYLIINFTVSVFAGQKIRFSGASDPVDTTSTTIGVRSIDFSKSDGLKINGKRYRLHGCNRHMSYPYIGNAVPKSGQYRDALRIKEYGFDFVRMSYYMQSESFVDACDKLGIAAMACLPGWQYFNDAQAFRDNSIKALRDMIRVYRNHPSVILYEAMHNESTPSSAYLRAAQEAAHEEYPGKEMFTCGEEGNNILDVYISSAQHRVREYAGSRPCVISEYGDWEHGCVWSETAPISGCQCRIERSAGESVLRSVAAVRADDIVLNNNCPWFTVDGVWSIFDYQSWSKAPYTASGDMDIFRIPKYPAYASKNRRSAAPGIIGEMMHQFRYTSSSTSPSAIRVDIDTAGLRFIADGSDIAIVYASIVDASGKIVSNATNSVTFFVSGPGVLVGNNPVSSVAGIASILLRSKTTPGIITITASSSGLSAGSTVTSHGEEEPGLVIFNQSAGSYTLEKKSAFFALCHNGVLVLPDKLFANPQTSFFHELILFDIQGKVTERIKLKGDMPYVNLPSLSEGVYMGKITGGTENLIIKILR